MPPTPVGVLIRALARVLLAAEQSPSAAHDRASRALGRNWRWLKPLCRRYVAAFENRTRPRHRDVIRFLREDSGFEQALRRYRGEIGLAGWLAEPSQMRPVPAAADWSVPGIATISDLADWLSLDPAQLEWFADLKRLNARGSKPKLTHYRYTLQPKRSGALRLIETPKRALKELQRRILTGILNRIPPHPAAHGFVKHRSILTFAQPHAGRDIVFRLDIENFFPAFPAARAEAVFRTFGYPEPVAARLAGLCSNYVPFSFWNQISSDIAQSGVAKDDWQTARELLYARPHLPQGAPTSPAMANIAAYRLDCRLSGLARAANANYTRYADDLAFSGGSTLAAGSYRLLSTVAAIALDEGFALNHHKTRIMRPGQRQQLTGLVLNRAPSPPHGAVKQLEAILTNCARRGPLSQNRDHHADFRAHLRGRIAFIAMVHPVKAARLRAIFNSIDWQT